MYDVFELSVMKSRALVAQREVIDELTSRLVRAPAGIEAVRTAVLAHDVLNLAGEPVEQIVRYFLLAVVASDIACVPYPEGRSYHLTHLGELAGSYGLDAKKVIHLTEHADVLLRELSGIDRRTRED